MSLTYFKILAQAAARVGEGGSIVGSSMAAVEANFNAFDSTKVDNAVFPFKLQAAALLMAEEKIASVVASVKDHPLRPYIRELSASLANRAVLPVVTASSVPVIGIPGAVVDSSDNKVLTVPECKNPAREIERINVLIADGVLTQSYYHYVFEGSTILHTRTNVKLELCKYNRATQAAAILADGAVLFTDALEELYVCGELSYLFENSEAPDNVQQYLQYFAKGLEMLGSGGLS